MPPARSPEDQVLANIRAQRIGAATVSDFDLPESFLRRVAGRILQLSFQNTFRLITPDETGEREDVEWQPNGYPAQPPDAAALHPAAVEMPAARGFLPSLAPGEDIQPRSPTGNEALVMLVAQRLARDGLLLTCAKAARLLRDSRGLTEAAGVSDALRDAGFPVDLLGFFRLASETLLTPPEVIGEVIARTGSANPSAWTKALAAFSFMFTPTVPGGRAMDDAGGEPVGALRLQLSRGGYWLGPGDGGSIDLFEQLLNTLPETPIIAVIERGHVERFHATTAAWPADMRQRIQLLPVDGPLSQWTQDNAKSMVDARGRPLLLLPRYASRGEQISQYIEGDTHLDRALAQADITTRRSPLLFQGGNLMLITEPAGRRVLLAGEAEVFRNSALGLTKAQATEALRREFGADAIVVLPAASIHIDYEVSCRVHAGRMYAFVADVGPALRLMLDAGLTRMVHVGALSGESAHLIRERLAEGRTLEGIGAIWGALMRAGGTQGRFPLRLARLFKSSPVDSGVGNLQRFMAALDLTLAAQPAQAAKVPDANVAAYLRNRFQLQTDRAALHAALRALGWVVVPVPALPQGPLSINVLNALHFPTITLTPCYGGIYGSLDEAAHAAIARTMPEIKVFNIRCGESQRRDGALRCSTATIPRAG